MSHHKSSLDEPLHEPITLDARTEIVLRLWRNRTSNTLSFENREWDAYFTYYTRECNLALVDQGIHVSNRTHRDLLTTAHLLEDEQTEDGVRQKLRQSLTQQRLPADEQRMLDGSIKLASRLVLMMNIGSSPSEISGKLALPWTKDSLRETIHDHFNDTTTATTNSNHDVFSTDLTCRNIERIAGIEIVPTDNLMDHLRLVDKDKKLCLFRHVTFLKRMLAVKWYVA
jgi:hypothetical protein